MPFVYILKSDSGKYYVGSTLDIISRLKHHLGGHTPSTSKMGKLSMAFSQEYQTLKEARQIELRLKKLKRKDFIEKIIKEGKIKIMPR
jgi:putative endonuclease